MFCGSPYWQLSYFAFFLFSIVKLCFACLVFLDISSSGVLGVWLWLAKFQRYDFPLPCCCFHYFSAGVLISTEVIVIWSQSSDVH